MKLLLSYTISFEFVQETTAHFIVTSQAFAGGCLLDGFLLDNRLNLPRANRWLDSPGNDLGSHPVRRTDHRIPLILIRGNLSAETEIRQLHLAVQSEEDIVTFDIAMNNFVLVQERQSFQTSFADAGDLDLWQHGLGADVGQSAAV